MKYGFDVDGVFADFNASFIRYAIAKTGRDLFPPRPFDIPTWNYPEHYGYTKAETTLIWDTIKADPDFWRLIPSYDWTWKSIEMVNTLRAQGHEVFYITNRMGVAPKRQTEQWLLMYGADTPTVIVSGEKGRIARALQLDAYVDDKWENCIDVSVKEEACTLLGKEYPQVLSKTKTFLFDQPWNRLGDETRFGVSRIFSLSQMIY